MIRLNEAGVEPASIFYLTANGGMMIRYLTCILLIVIGLTHRAVNAQEPTNPQLLSLKMLDQKDGWAVAEMGDDTFMIVQTQDGGKTWYSSLSNPGFYSSVAAYFLNQKHAWVFFQSHSIWYTDDGGQSWHEVAIKPALYGLTHGMLRFIDDKHGWFLGLNCCAAGNEYATLYQTIDGGKSWSVINDADQYRGLGSSYHTGFEVADNSVAWMTSSSINGRGGIGFTSDSGVNWNYSPLPVPPGKKDLQNCDMVTPFVFSARLVTFVTRCKLDPPATFLYHTTNGGRTWQVVSMPVSSFRYSPYYYMLSQLSGWCIAGTEKDGIFLYQTQDGGKHWTKLGSVPDKIANDDRYRFFFLNEHIGWVVAYDGTLYKTDDSGRTWTEVAVSLITEPSSP